MTVKIGFIGTGGIAGAHLNNLAKMDNVELAAFYDVDMQRAEKAASAHAGAKAFANLDDMLDGTRLDGVYVCVPPMAHGPAELKLIERGLPFLVEKPLGIDYELPADISRKVSEANLITSVGYHWRYMDSANKAKRLVAESKPGMALGYWLGNMPMVPWWRVMSGSGGQFVEQTTHIVDLLRYTCGEVKEVYAAYSLQVMNEAVPGTDVPDVGTVTMKLENGMVATISNSCMLPIYSHVGLDIFTNNGVLEIRGGDLREITPDGEKKHSMSANPMELEDEAFVHALLTGDSSRILSNYADALRSFEVTVAANESAVSGKPVLIR